MTRRIVLLLTFSLALALWARRRTKLEASEGDGVQPRFGWDAFADGWLVPEMDVYDYPEMLPQ